MYPRITESCNFNPIAEEDRFSINMQLILKKLSANFGISLILENHLVAFIYKEEGRTITTRRLVCLT